MPILSADPLNPQQPTQPVSTTGEVAAASFQGAWQSGLTSNFALNHELDVDEYGVTPSGSAIARGLLQPSDARAPGPTWTADQARQQLKDAGLDAYLKVPDTGIGRLSLRILMDRKTQELRRQTIEQEAQGGFWQGSARIGSSFAGTLVDPVNVAASFVPVVGEARYAELLAGASSALGRAGIRAAVGVGEGTLGLLPIEAYNFETKQRIQADYSAYDSLLSIASGGAFGGALHAGAGILGDTAGRALGWEPSWVAKARELREARAQDVFSPEAGPDVAAPPGPVGETRAAPVSAGDAAVADHFDQEARERAEIIDRIAQGRPLTREAAQAQAVANLSAEIRASLLGDAGAAADPGVVAAAKSELEGVTAELGGLEGQRRQLTKDINSQPGVTRKVAEARAGQVLLQRQLDLEARRTRAESIIAGNKTAADATQALSRLDRGEVPPEYAARVKAETDRLLGSTGELPLSAGIRAALHRDPFATVRPFLAKMQPATQAAALRMGIAQAVTGRAVDVTPALLADPAFAAHAPEIGALIRERTSTQGVATADHEAAKVAATQVARAPKGELVDEGRELVRAQEADVHALAKQAGVDLTPQLDAADRELHEARSAGMAARAASLCLLRTGT